MPRDFGYSETHEMLRASVARLLQRAKPLDALRGSLKGTEDPHAATSREGYFDRAAWKEMVDLGLSALAVPEPSGGLGLGLLSAVVVTEEIGRAAMPTPLSSTLQAAFLLNGMGTDSAAALQGDIAAGTSVTWGSMNASGELCPTTTAVASHAGKLHGTSYFVQDLQKADVLIVAAAEDGDLRWFAVNLQEESIEKRFDRIVDVTRDQGRVTFHGTPAERLSSEGADPFESAKPAILTLVAADAAGCAESLLQMTVEYAKTRVQFDRPIGFFQAVKHPLVDVMLRVDATRSLVYNAACAFERDPGDALRCAHLAKASASGTALFCANRGTQLHGGIGFAWEADVQIFHKRLLHSRYLFGGELSHREALARIAFPD